MIITDFKSNTDKWLAHRRLHLNASEAPMMMSASPNVTRNELLTMKATGLDREFGDWFQKNILDNGHVVEAMARPIAERIVGEDLYPVSATDDDGRLAASYDGMTMLETINWECKQWNKDKAADVEAGRVPECDYWQVTHQLAINPDSKTLYMITDGTEERTVHIWVEANQDDIKKLNAGWAQFEKDLAEYVPTEKTVQAVGEKPDSLPALRIVVEGAVTASNLPAFRDQALAMIASVKTDLQTDKDFADAAELVKAFKAGEESLESAKKRALSETASIEELFRTVDDVKEKMRSKRLEVDRLVKDQKEARKLDILNTSRHAFTDFINKLNVAKYMPTISADFAGAMKGKRTIESLQSACDDVMARAKIEANEIAGVIAINRDYINEAAADYRFLFNDFGQLCQKPADDFAAIVKSRIADHKQAEHDRLEAERAKIRAEEEVKARREAEATAQKEAAERQRVADQQQLLADQQRKAERAAEVVQQPAPVAQKTVQPEVMQTKVAPAKPQNMARPRPTASEMAAVIADCYSVTQPTALTWILEAKEKAAA